MICPPCRDGDHLGCPDFTRDKATWCACQHQERGNALTVTSGT